MLTASGFGYDYVFELASQLSLEEQERLAREIGECRKINLVEYTVPGEPIISLAEVERIKRQVDERPTKRNLEEIEKNRRELLEILLNAPVMSDEELQGIENVRKELNGLKLVLPTS